MSLRRALGVACLSSLLVVSGVVVSPAEEEEGGIDSGDVVGGVGNYRKSADAIDKSMGITPRRGIPIVRDTAKGVRRGVKVGTPDLPGFIGSEVSDFVDRRTLPVLARTCGPLTLRGGSLGALLNAGKVACVMSGPTASDIFLDEPIARFLREEGAKSGQGSVRKNGMPYDPGADRTRVSKAPTAPSVDQDTDDNEHIPYSGPASNPAFEDPVLGVGNYGECGPMTPEEKTVIEQKYGDSFTIAYEGIRLFQNRLNDPTVAANSQQAAQFRAMIHEQKQSVAKYIASHREESGCPQVQETEAQQCGAMSQEEISWISENLEPEIEKRLTSLKNGKKNLRNWEKTGHSDIDGQRDYVASQEEEISELLKEARSQTGSCPPVIPPECMGPSEAQKEHLAHLQDMLENAEFQVEKGEEHHRMFPSHAYPGKDLLLAREGLAAAQQELAAAQAGMPVPGAECGVNQAPGSSDSPDVVEGSEAANPTSHSNVTGLGSSSGGTAPAGYRRISPNACISGHGDVIAC